jgi:hypothetical protein
MRGFVLASVFLVAALCVPADPGYQLGEPRTNAVGLGAAAAYGSNGEFIVVGGSGDETRSLPASGAGSFLFRDTRLFGVSTQSWQGLQPLPLGQQRAFHSLSPLDPAAARVAVFGGSRDNLFLNDIWIYTRGEKKIFFSWFVLVKYDTHLTTLHSNQFVGERYSCCRSGFLVSVFFSQNFFFSL